MYYYYTNKRYTYNFGKGNGVGSIPFLFMVNKFKRMAAGVYSIHTDYCML